MIRQKKKAHGEFHATEVPDKAVMDAVETLGTTDTAVLAPTPPGEIVGFMRHLFCRAMVARAVVRRSPHPQHRHAGSSELPARFRTVRSN
jgi:hypothetical protein